MKFDAAGLVCALVLIGSPAFAEPSRHVAHSAASDGRAKHAQAPGQAARPSSWTPGAKAFAKRIFSRGTEETSPYRMGSVVGRGAHGNRIYCTISHFSYDDPIIYPGEPGKAHLHMFWGNTETNAHSGAQSIPLRGRSTCEGGANYRAGLWMPALYNERGEVVVPEQTFMYYKTFGGPRMERGGYALLREVPQGLEMLASQQTLNYHGEIRTQHTKKDGQQVFRVDIDFPSCVATDDGTREGNPVLSYRDMPGRAGGVVNSHVAYPSGRSGNEVECPSSHPYRFPTPMMKLLFAAEAVGKHPYVSSDVMKEAAPLTTLHADYIFGMDRAMSKQLLRCVKESRTCGFEGGRGSLPERFVGEEGRPVYQSSVKLLPEVDRTPFGATMPPMLGQHPHSASQAAVDTRPTPTAHRGCRSKGATGLRPSGSRQAGAVRSSLRARAREEWGHVQVK